jgi:YegS/Rv2252/BmrU family lipid kinase
MSERKLLYIVNPISGTHNKGGLRSLIESSTKASGIPFEIHSSVANGDYSFLEPLIDEQHFTDIVIAGGDGTVNQVVNSLKATDVRFGILPCGSGNGLAFSAGIPKNYGKALSIIFKGKCEWTDAFLVNDKFACMLCGIGFDAQVAHDFANDPRRGLATYVRKTISNFIAAKAYHFKLELAKRSFETDAFFISIANSNQFGNHFTIAPRASLTDGLLDVVIMTHQSKLSMLLQTIRQVTGFNPLQEVELLNEKAGILYFQTDSISISNPASAPMHIDGDPVLTENKIEVKMLKKHFKLIFP